MLSVVEVDQKKRTNEQKYTVKTTKSHEHKDKNWKMTSRNESSQISQI